jgi:hypothetical protein
MFLSLISIGDTVDRLGRMREADESSPPGMLDYLIRNNGERLGEFDLKEFSLKV